MIPTNDVAHVKTMAEFNAPLQIKKIQFALNGSAADLGILPEFRSIRSQFSIHAFEDLPSTSTKLWEIIRGGASAGSVVIARRQSAGRGQRGRIWQSSPGGLYLSLALEPDWPVTHIAQLTCMSTWGIATAFNNIGIPVKVKWPNDLFFEGKKLGGILTETKLSQASVDTGLRVRQAVIGVGINWHNRVPKTGTTLSKILSSLPEVSAKNKINCLEMLAALVLKGILQGHLFQQRVGSQDFMKAYSNLLTQVGEAVSLDGDLLNRAIIGRGRLDARLLQKAGQLDKCSGEVIGISEEGYLKVALRNVPNSFVNDLRKVSSDTLSSGSPDRSPGYMAPGCMTSILLLKPASTYDLDKRI